MVLIYIPKYHPQRDFLPPRVKRFFLAKIANHIQGYGTHV